LEARSRGARLRELPPRFRAQIRQATVHGG
jgi:hypothetical protein